MSASQAKMAAQKAMKAETAEEKLDLIAKAIYQLAGAVKDVEDKLHRVEAKVNSLR